MNYRYANNWQGFFCNLQGSASIWRVQQPYLNSSFCATAYCCNLSFDQMSNHMECTWDFDLTLGLCHFNFSWAVFTACFHKFWTLLRKVRWISTFCLLSSFQNNLCIALIFLLFQKNQSNEALFSWSFCENIFGTFIKLQFIFCRLKRWKKL